MTKFAFFDLDKTLYDGYSTSDFCTFMAENGWCDRSVYRENEILQNLYTGSLESYDEISLGVIKLGIKVLKGMTREQILSVEDEFIKVYSKLYPYTYPLLHLLKKAGFMCYLISAATFPPVEVIGRNLSMPFYASTGIIKDRKYTGELKIHLNGEAKRQAIKNILEGTAQPTFSLSFGDSTGDLPLLETADQAFVLNAHQEAMVALSHQRGYHLSDADHIIRDVEAVLNSRSGLS